MNFFTKLGKVLKANIEKTIGFVVALILFLYFSDGDLIAGLLTTVFAIIVVGFAFVLVHDFKNYHEPKPAAAKKTAKKSTKKK